MIPLSAPLQKLIEHLSSHSVRPIFVGGFVRDYFTGRENIDLDIELYGVTSLETLETLLKPFGKINVVGKSFGVLKLSYNGYNIDFSPPRNESKHGHGHKGFEITWLSDIDYPAAARRRDFTINSIGYDPLNKTLLDPYGGVEDLKRKRLACVDPATFVDDPLRVLRAIQFAARFELTCDETLLNLCRTMISEGALEELPKERIFEEFKKLLLQSDSPSIGLKLLREMGGLPFFSPLDLLESTPQNPDSHPEGSVWNHTLMCVDAMASERTGEAKHDLGLMFAALLHDIAKPATTITINGYLYSPEHASKGVAVAREWLWRITEDKSLTAAVLPLIEYHGWPRKLHRLQVEDPEILRLSTHVCIDDLIRIARADFFGRGFSGEKPHRFDAGEWLYERAVSLGVLHTPPAPFVMGRDLIDIGLTPSDEFKIILETAYDAQLNQLFSTRSEALDWIRNHLKSHPHFSPSFRQFPS
ncbi:HD domain-containing protein [Sulfuricurvum sp.]|uniref:CCA tRNA nucleotidyltransferase n=1 Tax=Sulfuricurvum sp. TaxID=2025608 RepID=UPI00260BD1D0|nr:HD domain-containing protein [Sulfuricurvum sp.]MDD4884003.1 HD domain-containing protein [Sulfuricurvum sp.]